jgi:5-methylcytosine-specific restriction endonuclease McrA
MERDRYACTYCGSDKQLEADHILPLSRGGSNAGALVTA